MTTPKESFSQALLWIYDATAQAIGHSAATVWPAEQRDITQQSHPGHTAIDIGLHVNTPIYAPASGVVIATNRMDARGYGNLLLIRTDDGKTLWFAHLNQFVVKIGQRIQRGQEVALSGNTWSPPGHSTGPHLHFAVQDSSGKFVNPAGYFSGIVLNPQSQPLSLEQFNRLAVAMGASPRQEWQNAPTGQSPTVSSPSFSDALSWLVSAAATAGGKPQQTFAGTEPAQPESPASSSAGSQAAASGSAAGTPTAEAGNAQNDGQTVLAHVNLIDLETPIGSIKGGIDITPRIVFACLGLALVIIGLVRIAAGVNWSAVAKTAAKAIPETI
jgi:hypothetical protein